MFQWIKKVWQRSFENPAVPVSSPMAYEYLGGRRATSGVAVDRVSVLGYPAIFRCVNLISHKVGRLPLHVYKRNKDGGREVDLEHPAQWLLQKRPSDLYTPFTFKSTLQAHALLHGNAYAWIDRDPQARPTSLIVLDPTTTFPVFDKGRLYYVIRVGMQDRKLLPENVFHLRGLSHDGVIGYSVIDVLREAFGIGIAAQRYGAVFFRNNGSPGPTIIKLPAHLKDKDAVKRFREQWSFVHEGIDNSHRIALLEGGAEIQPWKVDNDTAQFLQTREFEVVQIANIFGVPAHKLGAKIATSYNSLESEERAFLSDGLDGWLTAWEEECDLKLLKDSQLIRDSHFVEFDRRSLEQADYRTRSETLIAEVNNGIRTQNEARQDMNLEGVGPDGDRLRIPTNITYTDMLANPDDIAATDEPGPMAETPATGNPNAPMPGGIQTDPVGNQPGLTTPTRLHALTQSVLQRYLVRLRKAATAASKDQGWYAWLDGGLASHRAILSKGIEPVSDQAEQLAEQLLDELRQELAAVTRDQLDAVFDRVSIEQWTERIINGTKS